MLVKAGVETAINPIADGFFPCGACGEYVEKCKHYKRKIDIHVKMPEGGPTELIRQQVIKAADGYCQTCGRLALLLYPRVVCRTYGRGLGLLRPDNAMAICAICRTSATNLGLREWVDSGSAPEQATALMKIRLAQGLPV